MTDSSENEQGTSGAERGPSVVVLDAKGLRVLAHPVRVQLIGQLRAHGPSTATRLAERLGVNSATASYHLRQLAGAGFVVEETDRGNARERWWRAAHEYTVFDDRDIADQEPEAARVYLQSVAAAYGMRLQQAIGDFETAPRQWREAFDMSDWRLDLTPEEAQELHRELVETIERRRTSTPTEGAEHVSIILTMLPEPAAEEEP